MIYKRLVANRIIITIFCTIIYFLVDVMVQKAGFLNFNPYLGLKNFLPVTLALLFGAYGIIGAFVGCSITALIVRTPINFVLMEYVCIVIPGFLAWFFWHIGSRTHKIHFKWPINYLRYIIIILISYWLCAMISKVLVGGDMKNILIWHISLCILIGIPIDIMYSGLMCLNPILPPLKENGKKINIKDDIVFNLSSSVDSYAALSEMVEDFAMQKKINMKRMFEIQSCIEEFYLRISHAMPNAYIDFRANYDITFSVEFNYIGKKYNPLYIKKGEELDAIAGLSLIKHRALLASYSYLYGENNVHVVI